jgi:type IV secretory pathway VirB2 component (pilin)
MKTFIKKISAIFLTIFLILSSSQIANAQSITSISASADDNSLTRVLCNVMRIVTGNAGKTFAAFAIISAGIGFFTGKLQWGLLIALTLGIAAIFGAPKIVAAITGEEAAQCTGTQGINASTSTTATTTAK